MDQADITILLDSFKAKQDRTIVIVDYGNVEKWKRSLNWFIGVKELGQLVKSFSQGKKELRRFYYGSDYGKKESSKTLVEFSRVILEKAEMNRFEVVTKKVKYIHDRLSESGFAKKCDFDVEMTVDLIKFRKFYDNIILFSGDGDLMYAIKYLHDEYAKNCLVFGVRGHLGREVFDAQRNGFVTDIVFTEDFEYRLNKNRFFR
ncbi:MAG: NYN domain-containing protein [Candidatus Komeilibacteria bacterium]|nr:NYN domain-containing protein [Candidatus Komeilibacteria bacterium]